MAVSTPKLLAPKVEPKSNHVSDPSLQPFLQPDFDPADYLNSTLPPLSVSTSSSRNSRSVPLPELSSQLQTLLSQLNAQTSRLSNTLTQLTDEIIRSGSRLAYEVEVLRGETIGLTDTLDNGLKKDIELFVPEKKDAAGEAGATTETEDTTQGKTEDAAITEPEFLERLRTFTTVRERLDSVIKIFGAAMQWPLAPSELQVASSFISVSAPDDDETRSREEKGKEFTEKLRTEINDLFATGTEGLEAATTRVDELRTLAEVWKGTTEEKARYKLVETLQKLVDDKQKALGKAAGENGRKPGVSPARGYDYRYGNMEIPKAPQTQTQTQHEGGSGYGFLQNLKNLRNEMYLD